MAGGIAEYIEERVEKQTTIKMLKYRHWLVGRTLKKRTVIGRGYKSVFL